MQALSLTAADGRPHHEGRLRGELEHRIRDAARRSPGSTHRISAEVSCFLLFVRRFLDPLRRVLAAGRIPREAGAQRCAQVHCGCAPLQNRNARVHCGCAQVQCRIAQVQNAGAPLQNRSAHVHWRIARVHCEIAHVHRRIARVQNAGAPLQFSSAPVQNGGVPLQNSVAPVQSPMPRCKVGECPAMGRAFSLALPLLSPTPSDSSLLGRFRS
jgi:hypothetical protein